MYIWYNTSTIEGVENMNIRKKIASLVLATTMIMGLAACSNKDEEIPYTFGELLTEFSGETNLDELMAKGSKIEIIC